MYAELTSNVVIRGLAINNFGENIALVGGTGHKVEGNFIGTDPSGTSAEGNDVGVHVGSADDATIGSSSLAARNLISGNDVWGVWLEGGSAGNTIQGNLIGTKANGTVVLANFGNGVELGGGASENVVGGSLSSTSNTIAFNNADGVTVDHEASIDNGIPRNSVFQNGRLGIDLVGGSEIGFGTTTNDEDDVDEGPNNLQNKPELTSAATGGGSTTIDGNTSEFSTARVV